MVVIVPTTEAELATAIEILKKTDNKEKAELAVLYNAINGSGLEGAGSINNLDDLSSFIAQTNRTLKNSRGERDAIYKAINGSKLEGAGSIDNFSALSTFITNTKKNIDKSGQATTDIYDTIQKSNLPGADQVITGNKTSVEKFISDTGNKLREDNNTIEECQKHFTDIDTEVGRIARAIIPPETEEVALPGIDVSTGTTQQSREESCEK